MPPNPAQANPEESSLSFQSLISLLAAMSIGLMLAMLVLPRWVPAMAYSLSGEEPRAYWYLARASAFASVSLLWLSMALGMGITNKMARLWPGAPAAFAVHEYVNLLGIAFAIFHALVLLGDRYIGFTLVQLLVPFSTSGFRPLWVGLGQLTFYIWLLVTISFYVRKAIGQKTWRALHYMSFLAYLTGIFHGIFSGTDSSVDWVQKFYWFTAGSLIFLFIYRILAVRAEKKVAEKSRRAAVSNQPAGRAIAAVPAPKAEEAH